METSDSVQLGSSHGAWVTEWWYNYRSLNIYLKEAKFTTGRIENDWKKIHITIFFFILGQPGIKNIPLDYEWLWLHRQVMPVKNKISLSHKKDTRVQTSSWCNTHQGIFSFPPKSICVKLSKTSLWWDVNCRIHVHNVHSIEKCKKKNIQETNTILI